MGGKAPGRRPSPQMSVVLVSDGYETIRPVIDRLAAQTAKERVEVVLVGPVGSELGAGTNPDGFAGVQVVDVDSPLALGDARAAGVRAASAPLVFIGETHSYPHPRMAEELIRTHAGPWAAVVPAFGNANPDGAASWAGFLSDYGAWTAAERPGEVRFAPMYNSSFRRSVLLEFGDRLGSALRGGDEMANGLRTRKHRVFFAPAARIDHVSVSSSRGWVHERYLAGRLIGGARARRWSWGRRLLYLCAAPLLPGVYLSRVRAGILAARRDRSLPLGTYPMLLVGALIKAAGEVIGYARGVGPNTDSRMTEYELHRTAYVSPRTR